MDFRATLDAVPRLTLAFTPTPLRRVAALERALARSLGREVPRILVKHDDMTGFGLGGNKVRKLETELGGDRLEGVTCLITTGGPQSNHARVTAAVAAWLGLECEIVVNGSTDGPARGNALLQRKYGARIHTVTSRDERNPTMERIALEVAERGGRARVVPLGASTPLGALAYARAFVELEEQLEPGGSLTRIFVSSSSGGTLGGLHLGQALSERRDLALVAVSADTPAPELREIARDLATAARDHVGVTAPLREDGLVVVDAQVGPGYGVATDASRRASDLFARHAGIILDETYTAKAAAELIAAVERETSGPEERVLFWHTGGWPSALI